MPNREHLAILSQGIEVWNEWRKENPAILPDLREATLSGANLKGIDLLNAQLYSANLQGAKLNNAKLNQAQITRANLLKSDLTDANLRKANIYKSRLDHAILTRAGLVRADFTETSLFGANLVDANLIGTKFTDVDLQSSNIAEVRLEKTIFVNCELSGIIGTDTCKHLGPSSIDIKTIQRSWPKSVQFLRESGLPEDFIKSIPSIIGQAFQFYSCFISYSSADTEFANRLYSDLQNNGVRCWFAEHDMVPGQKIFDQVAGAIRKNDRLLLILSVNSMNSDWVMTEIASARKKEIEQERRVLFPIRLVDFNKIKKWTCFDADTGKDSAKEIREYFIPDFSNWKIDQNYQAALKSLINGLKAG